MHLKGSIQSLIVFNVISVLSRVFFHNAYIKKAGGVTSPPLFVSQSVFHLVVPGDRQAYTRRVQRLHHKLCMNPKHWPSQTTTALHQGQALMNLIVQLEESVCILLKQSAFHQLLPPAPSLYGSFIRFWISSSKAFFVQAVLCSFQQREAFFFYIPSSLIVDCHFSLH